MKRFGYLHDRLFIGSMLAYAVNRLLLRPHGREFFQSHCPCVWPFLHSHLDDLLLMPVALPVMLWLQRMLGLRKHDDPPSWAEIFTHLTVWSVMCKFISPVYFHIGVADPWDVLFFAAGGIVSGLWWQYHLKTNCSTSA